MDLRDRNQRVFVAVLSNGLVLGTLVYAAVLQSLSPDLYYLTVQEDEYLEWATFWAFILAAALATFDGIHGRHNLGHPPWWLWGVGLFCLVVAMEEISWGQRVLAYRPPTYFLEHNFQQELNLHNVVATDYRQLALAAVILGYGVVLPCLVILSWPRAIARRMGIVTAPLGLIPAFLGMYVFYEVYPLDYSGEWVELMMGFGFLFAALASVERHRERWNRFWPLAIGRPVGLWVLVLAAGFATAAWSRIIRTSSPDTVMVAQAEISALQDDFATGELLTRCGIHKRLYTYMGEYDQDYLRNGEFARLNGRGLPQPRADFLLDPWNLPYWIRHSCTPDRTTRAVFVYSFGPNRRRDSTAWEIGGDDIGATIHPDR